MQPSICLLAAAILASLSVVAGQSTWAKMSTYLKSPGRPFVLARAYPSQTEFKCSCQGTGNKIFKELIGKDNWKQPTENIRVHFDKRLDKCNDFAPSMRDLVKRNQLYVALTPEIEQKLDRCLRRLFNIACCSTPETVLKSNADIYTPIDDLREKEPQSSRLLDFQDYCEKRPAVTYPQDCPAETDQMF